MELSWSVRYLDFCLYKGEKRRPWEIPPPSDDIFLREVETSPFPSRCVNVRPRRHETPTSALALTRQASERRFLAQRLAEVEK